MRAQSWLKIALTCAALAGIFHPAAWAGSGRVNTDGTIDLTVNLRFPATPEGMTGIRNQLTEASRVLFDASEGQLRIGRVTITCTSVSEGDADYWVYANPIRASSCIDCLGTRGGRVAESFSDPGAVWAHEFGHLGLALFDEYTENQADCDTRGWCIEEDPPAHSEQDQCLMQQIPGRSWTELCVAVNHDGLRGDNTTCRTNPPHADGAPCTSNCQLWNTTTRRYETTEQTRARNVSCWESLVAKFPFLTLPAGRPQVAPPAGFVAPTFTETCSRADTILLLLDRSGSMSWSVANDWGEVCGNGRDDDGDGSTDETDCAQARIDFVRAAARIFLQLSGAGTFRAGIVTFNDTPASASGFVEVGSNLATLLGIVDGPSLTPGGLTAIGDALAFGKTLFDADAAASGSKAALIITDGQNTAGSDPGSPVPGYQAAGIRIFAISTGEASDAATLSAISTATRGIRLDTRDPTALVTTIAEQWANYINSGVVVPQTPYAVRQDLQDPEVFLESTDRPTGYASFVPAPTDPSKHFPGAQTIEFPIEEATESFTAVLAGNLNDMARFGVRAVLRSPGGTVIDSTSAGPGTRIVLDPYFLLVTIPGPQPGIWRLEVTAAPGAFPAQTGNLIVISENPRTDLFADLDKTVVTNPADTSRLTLLPFYFTGLRDVAWEVKMRRPDGVEVPVPVTQGLTPETYHATLTGFPFSGVYDVIATLRTQPATTNDPGEGRPGTAPPNSLPVPFLERTARLSLFADVGLWPCLTPPDCDRDGNLNESPLEDGDGDGVPAPNDPDDNGNEIPDAAEDRWPLRRYRFAFRLGSAHPLADLDRVADPNIAVQAAVGIDLNPSFTLFLTGGLSQFTADGPQPNPRWSNLSANLRLWGPALQGRRWFLQAGPGLYESRSGGSAAGANAGFGLEVPFNRRTAFELDIDYHWVNADQGRFITAVFGLSLR